jgi:hypothetical protein
MDSVIELMCAPFPQALNYIGNKIKPSKGFV